MKIESVKSTLSRYPRVELGAFPTPLQPMENLCAKLGAAAPLYIKRDDLTGLGAGGNKVRNLEYLLGDALARRSDVIIASGKSQSNLCSLTVCACRKMDLDCIIFHNDERPEHRTGNQVLNHLAGADLRYIGDMPDSQREAFVERYQEELLAQGRRPYIIYNGASTALGSLGYVHAMAELCEQCVSLPVTLEHLFVPGGNGGLAAGVIFGSALAQAPFHVHVITVEHEVERLSQILHSFLRDLQELTGELQGYPFDEHFTIHGEYRGDGWGHPTEESIHQIYDLAQTEGIYVEKVYTSKTLYGMLDMVRKGMVSGACCYLHSGGFGALFSQF